MGEAWGARGQDVRTSKLKNETVIEIKKRLLAGESVISIAKDLGVSRGTISNIKTGHSWSHIKLDKDV